MPQLIPAPRSESKRRCEVPAVFDVASTVIAPTACEAPRRGKPKRTGLARRLLALLAAAALPLALSAAEPAEKKAAVEELPLSKVVMFNSGVAFYEHLGDVNGTAQVDFKFRTESINDLLKSMVLQDLDGGKVSTITYASRDPIQRTLGSFAIDLTNNPTLGQLLAQIRGEEIELGGPDAVRGTIVGLERKPVQVGEQVREVESLTLLTEAGLKSVALDRVGRVKITNPKLDGELRQALAVLALGHADDKKTVSLSFQGDGKRRVQVGYIQEAPVWKTSYRLILSDEKKPTLQGWAIVENTTEQDWKDVGLTLVSGRPISFRMDLYTPLYTERPLVEPELYASLRPQTYNESLESRDARFKNAAPGALQQRAALAAAAPAKREEAAKALADEQSWGSDKKRAFERGNQTPADWAGSVQAGAQGGEVGELFQYVIESPVTLPRRQSAMLPIVNGSIEAEKVDVYNARVQAKHPLNGFQLKNTAGVNLLQGPITVFDGGAYAGDARILDLAPGATRLVTYALDLDVEVAPEQKSKPDVLTAVKIVRGVLEATTTYNRSVKYTVKNSGGKAKKVLVEQPFDASWKLVQPAAPAEKTRDLYRFAVAAEPGKPAELVVEEERSGPTHYRISNTGEDVLRMFITSTVSKPEVKQALEEVIRRQHALAQLARQRETAENEIKTIDAEQARIRENMKQIPREGDLYARYVKKFNAQEDLIEARRQTIKSLVEMETKARNDLNQFIEGINL